MMPARRQSWWQSFWRRQFPPRDPEPTMRQKVNSLQEYDDEDARRRVRERYDREFNQFSRKLAEIHNRQTSRRRE